MRRCAARRNDPVADESGFIPGVMLKAVHKKNGTELTGEYKGLSSTKKTLRMGDVYVSPNDYTITEIAE